MDGVIAGVIAGVVGLLFDFGLPLTVVALLVVLAFLAGRGDGFRRGRLFQARYHVQSAFIDAVLAQPPVEVRAVGVAQVPGLPFPHPRRGEQ